MVCTSEGLYGMGIVAMLVAYDLLTTARNPSENSGTGERRSMMGQTRKISPRTILVNYAAPSLPWPGRHG
jgi:hypothetical protein